MDDLGLWHITVRQDEMVGYDHIIQLATGLYIDKKALPVGICSYLTHSTPDTAVFSFHEEGKPSDEPDTAVLSVTRLSSDNPEDYNLWKSRVSSYLLYKSGLGARRAWTCDCRSLRYEDDHYGESLVGLCACRIPAGFRLLPLTQYLACGLANPLQTFTASYVWNKSWRWGDGRGPVHERIQDSHRLEKHDPRSSLQSVRRWLCSLRSSGVKVLRNTHGIAANPGRHCLRRGAKLGRVGHGRHAISLV